MAVLHAAYLILALLIAETAAVSLPYTTRATTRSDIIGVYSLHPSTQDVANSGTCPQNLTTTTFEFEVTRSPSFLTTPSAFNIRIPHVNTLVDDRMCESSGHISAVTSDHPFVADIKLEAVTAWSKAGRLRQAKWVTEEFISAVARQPFIVAYDFFERSCRGAQVRAGVSYLWFQPAWAIFLGDVQLSGLEKYLILTFAGQRNSGCLYVADAVGGEGDFPKGPVSDPSLEAAENNPKPSSSGSGDDDGDDGDDTGDDGSSGGGSSGGGDDDDDDDDDDDEVGPSDAPIPNASSEPGASQDPSPTPSPSPSVSSDDDTIFGSGGEASGGDTKPNPIQNDPGGVFEQEEGSDSRTCFPASANVQLEDGSLVSMRNLQTGDIVRTAHDQSSDIFFFSHRYFKPHVLHDYIRIHTACGRALTISPEHYLYRNERLSPARAVAEGDRLTLASGEQTRVVSVQIVKEEGLFAPHTIHGDIVVNGFKVSTYTTAVHPKLAHYILLAPVRALYRIGMVNLVEGILDNGSDRLSKLAPKGPKVLEPFL